MDENDLEEGELSSDDNNDPQRDEVKKYINISQCYIIIFFYLAVS